MIHTDNAFATESLLHTHNTKNTVPQAVRFALKPLKATNPAPVLYASFNCLVCKKTYCLPGAELLPLMLPEGFNTDTLRICVSGTCDACNQKRK